MEKLHSYDKWNEYLKRIDYKGSGPKYFEEREVWWTSIGYNPGYEELGKGESFTRPVLIVRKFNRELFFGIPLSKKVKDNRYYLPIFIKGEKVSALLSQTKTFSSRRIRNFITKISHNSYEKVVRAITDMIKI